MSHIKEIFDSISTLSGKKDKIAELGKHKDNQLLQRVIYLAHSPRVNFYIKQIPAYNGNAADTIDLTVALDGLDRIINRELTGYDAIDHLSSLLESLPTNDAYVLERIIDKNLKIGMDTSINKVFPKLIEETPYMGAKSFSVKGAKKLFGPRKDGSGKMKLVASQIKADGTYRNAIIKDGQVELLSRQGEISHLKGSDFLKELAQFEDCVLNGELTIDGYDRYTANGMVSSMMDIIEKQDDRGPEKTQKKILEFAKEHGDWDEVLTKLRFTVWDMITVDEYYEAKSDTPYTDRFQNLKNLIKQHDTKMVDIVETKWVYSFEEAMEHFLDAQARGLEGTIIKAITEGWKDGKPTYQIKMKLEMNIDLRIVKPVFGNVGTKYETKINGFILESSCGTIRTTARGVKEAEMEIFTKLGDKMIGDIIETKCCGLSQDREGNWSLLHPSVVEYRTDKTTCDSLESAKEIEEMAKTLKELA